MTLRLLFEFKLSGDPVYSSVLAPGVDVADAYVNAKKYNKYIELHNGEPCIIRTTELHSDWRTK